MTATRPHDGALDEWSRLHGGYDPRRSRLVRRWLRVVFAVARPLAACGVAPIAITCAAVVAAAAACPLAAGGRWLRVGAAALVLVSAALDGVDGAVAVVAGRASRWGGLLDSVADRLSDVAFVVVLWLAGGRTSLAVVAGGAVVLFEYARARAAAVGMTDIGLVTVAERPTRVLVTVSALVVGGVWSSYAGDVATAGLAGLVAVSVVGLGQLLVVARRALEHPQPLR